MHPMPDRPHSDRERISAALHHILDFTPSEAHYLAVRKFMNEDPDQFIPRLEIISRGFGERIAKIAVKAATILRFPVERIQNHVDRICRDGWSLEVARLYVFGCPDVLDRTEADVDATFNAMAILIPKSEDRRFFMSVKPRICMIPGERILACAKLARWDDDPEALWRAIASTPVPEPSPQATVVEPVPQSKAVTPRPSPPPSLRRITTPPQPAPAAVRPASTRPSTTTMRAIPRADETPLPQSSRMPVSRPPTPIRPKKERPSLRVPHDDDDYSFILNWREVVRSILQHTQKESLKDEAWKKMEPELSWVWASGSNGSKALTSICRWLNLRRSIERPAGTGPSSTFGEEQLQRMRFLGEILRSERFRDILRLDQKTLEYRMAVLRRFIDLDFTRDPSSLLKPWESLPPEELRYRVNEIVGRGKPPGVPPYIDILLDPTREMFLKNLDICPLLEKRHRDPV